MTDSLEPLTKIGLYAALLILIGSCTAFWLARTTGADPWPDSTPWTVAAAAVSTVLVFLLFRIFAHTWLTFGSDGSLLENLALIGFRSRWGDAWRHQVLTAVAVLGVVLWARGGAFMQSVTASFLAATLAWTFTRMGHSAGTFATSLTATAHMVGGGLWLGTVTVLVLTRHEGTLWSRFSPVALTGAAIVSSSGLILLFTYLSSWRDLFESSYGRTFVVKMACFGGIVGCGFLNWRQVRQSTAPDVRPRSARIEVTLSALLIAITAFLTEIDHP